MGCYPRAFKLLPPRRIQGWTLLMSQNEDREWRLREHADAVPLMFSIKATKA
jgi:hypothetical protein